MQRKSLKHDLPQDGYDESYYRATFRDAPYYSSGRSWTDYAPAYLYGHRARDAHPGTRFEDVEAQLAADWLRCRDDSRLQWTEARGAVRDAWRHHDDGAGGVRFHHGH
ncbi:hypothetical protein [Luteimonas lutimaris]|uniref:Uncharacterized protein n=1 Tax=Luteimonas lutimaris TaxID=698645 RepID=A0ABP7M0P5_9GAMM|nr:hypothetical protein [Luteimonas sp.]